LTAKLNVQADKIATYNARKLINTHLITSPFAIYVANNYIPHNIDNKIRESSHSKLAQDFLKQKYKPSTKTMNLINWEAHSTCIRKLSHSKKRFIRRFIHHRLPTGKMQFLNRSRCPHCDTMFNNETHHDHFLTCVQTSDQKHTRLQSLTNMLNKLHTRPSLRDQITIQIRNYYNDGLTNDDDQERTKILLMNTSIIN